MTNAEREMLRLGDVLLPGQMRRSPVDMQIDHARFAEPRPSPAVRRSDRGHCVMHHRPEGQHRLLVRGALHVSVEAKDLSRTPAGHAVERVDGYARRRRAVWDVSGRRRDGRLCPDQVSRAVEHGDLTTAERVQEAAEVLFTQVRADVSLAGVAVPSVVGDDGVGRECLRGRDVSRGELGLHAPAVGVPGHVRGKPGSRV